jgi:hypothetical protein
MIASRHPTFPLFLLMLTALSATGCASTPAKSLIPPGARLEANQKGTLAFFAREQGTLYITDAKASQLIYTTPVNPNDKLFFDPTQDRILLNGFAVKQTTLDQNRVYRLYFLKG